MNQVLLITSVFLISFSEPVGAQTLYQLDLSIINSIEKHADRSTLHSPNAISVWSTDKKEENLCVFIETQRKPQVENLFSGNLSSKLHYSGKLSLEYPESNYNLNLSTTFHCGERTTIVLTAKDLSGYSNSYHSIERRKRVNIYRWNITAFIILKTKPENSQ